MNRDHYEIHVYEGSGILRCNFYFKLYESKEAQNTFKEWEDKEYNVTDDGVTCPYTVTFYKVIYEEVEMPE